MFRRGAQTVAGVTQALSGRVNKGGFHDRKTYFRKEFWKPQRPRPPTGARIQSPENGGKRNIHCFGRLMLSKAQSLWSPHMTALPLLISTYMAGRFQHKSHMLSLYRTESHMVWRRRQDGNRAVCTGQQDKGDWGLDQCRTHRDQRRTHRTASGPGDVRGIKREKNRLELKCGYRQALAKNITGKQARSQNITASSTTQGGPCAP